MAAKNFAIAAPIAASALPIRLRRLRTGPPFAAARRTGSRLAQVRALRAAGRRVRHRRCGRERGGRGGHGEVAAVHTPLWQHP
jgi:hypothetical protein